MPQWNFYKYLLDHEGNVLQVCTVLYYILYCIVLHCLYCTALQVWPPQTPVEDIYDAVEAAVHEADGELQVESPLGSHDEL